MKLTAEAHGGTLSIESVEGEGTTFRVVLPLPVGTLPAEARRPAAHPPRLVWRY